MNNNTIQIDPQGIIRATLTGDQSYTLIHDLTIKLSEVIAGLRSENKSILLLVDIRTIGTIDSGSRKAGFEFIQSLDFDKLATIVSTSYIKYTALFVASLSNKKDKISVTYSEKEAIDFLSGTSS